MLSCRRLIPAHAGVIPLLRQAIPIMISYLRACGGDPAELALLAFAGDLSPRTRGQSHIRFVLKCLQAGFLRGGQDGETRTGLAAGACLFSAKSGTKKIKSTPF